MGDRAGARSDSSEKVAVVCERPSKPFDSVLPVGRARPIDNDFKCHPNCANNKQS